MCDVPAGSFMMGCNSDVDADCRPDESPYHEVFLDGFLIDRHEVTVDEYKKCVDAGVCNVPRFAFGFWYCNYGKEERGDHPQNCMEWYHARDYCAWVDKRLPTEAEWEKAARGTEGQKYPWGNSPAPSCDNTVLDNGKDGCGTNSTWPVCSRLNGNSPYGLCDTMGNVFEWVADRYDENYYQDSPANNPQGPRNGKRRVLRGGTWNRPASSARASLRAAYPPWQNPYCRGFRCAYTEKSQGNN